LVVLVYPLSFFFSCSAHLSPLHSFPTRRSSDLSATLRPARPVRPAHLPEDSSAARARSYTARPTCRRNPSPHRRARRCSGCRPRSEEHTSELQSPCNLVCRLLLEKKKKKKTKKK